MKSHIPFYAHLGDKIASCVILNSLARQAGRTIKVGACADLRDIIEVLRLEALEFDNQARGSGFEYSIGELTGVTDSDIPFLSNRVINTDFKIDVRTSPDSHYKRKEWDEVTLFQFDSRSQNEKKRGLTRSQSMWFLKRNSRFRPVGVGGTDTKKCLPYEYRLGDLHAIAAEMCRAGQFVGVDSGMSHIAGVMGVPSRIYLMHVEERDIRAVEKFYALFYPETQCVHDLSSGRRPGFRIF